jgi:hypothetical protein
MTILPKFLLVEMGSWEVFAFIDNATLSISASRLARITGFSYRA